jgi:hypothetical protein
LRLRYLGVANFDVQAGARRGINALVVNAIVFAVIGALSANNARKVRVPVAQFVSLWIPILLVPMAAVVAVSLIGSFPLCPMIRAVGAALFLVVAAAGLGLSFDTGDGVCQRLVSSLTGSPWASCFTQPGFAAAFFWAAGATGLSLVIPITWRAAKNS